MYNNTLYFKTLKFDFYMDMLNFQVPYGGHKLNPIELKIVVAS